MKTKIVFLLMLLLNFLLANDKFESAYTSIADKDCKVIETYKMNIGVAQSCKKYTNIDVEVKDSDARMSITLHRNNKEYPLNFSSTVSASFSSLGKKIEWRYLKGKAKNPMAMITRLNVSEYNHKTELNDKDVSYLVVSKITKDDICVVGKIKPQKNQNILARKMADDSHKLKCILEQKTKSKKLSKSKNLSFIKDKELEKVMDKSMENFNYVQSMGPIEQSIRLMEFPTYAKWHLRLQLYPVFSELRKLSGYKVVFERLNLSGSSKTKIPADRHELIFNIEMNNPALFSKEKSHFNTFTTSYKSTSDDGDWGLSKRIILDKAPWESKIDTLAALVRALAKESGWLQGQEWNAQEIPEGMNNSTPWAEITINNHLGIDGSYMAEWHDLVSDDSIAKTMYYIYVDDDETKYALINKAFLCGRGENTTLPTQRCQ